MLELKDFHVEHIAEKMFQYLNLGVYAFNTVAGFWVFFVFRSS